MKVNIKMKIREIRESKNISLSKLAQEAKVSIAHLSDIERNIKEPTLSVLVRIAIALEVEHIDELYEVYLWFLVIKCSKKGVINMKDLVLEEVKKELTWKERFIVAIFRKFIIKIYKKGIEKGVNAAL